MGYELCDSFFVKRHALEETLNSSIAGGRFRRAGKGRRQLCPIDGSSLDDRHYENRECIKV